MCKNKHFNLYIKHKHTLNSQLIHEKMSDNQMNVAGHVQWNTDHY